MNKLLIVFVSIILLSSCDNRDVFIKSLNPLPDIQLVSKDGQGKDSVKYSLKSIKKEARYNVIITGNNAEKTVSVKTVNDGGSVSFNGKNGDGDVTIPTNGTYSLLFTPTGTGTTLIDLTLKDSFGNYKEVSTEVYVFDNKPPVASLVLTNIAVVAPREYVLDASSSYDSDASYGGFISFYTFKIGNQKFVTDKSSIKWIFGSAGNYEVSVMVNDSDGSTSTFSKIYTIQ